MKSYQVMYSYSIIEDGTMITEANSVEDAEINTRDHIHENYPEATDIVIEGVREINGTE